LSKLGNERVNILHEDCDPELANDKSLPNSAFLVEYYDSEGNKKYDISSSYKQVDLFDFYYDKYKKGFKGWIQAEGRIDPKMYGYKSKVKESKK
tara:strand:+ start:22377 stop:22658 length:282 start_codon:yes stop_codon:yes gene_type:complete